MSNPKRPKRRKLYPCIGCQRMQRRHTLIRRMCKECRAKLPTYPAPAPKQQDRCRWCKRRVKLVGKLCADCRALLSPAERAAVSGGRGDAWHRTVSGGLPDSNRRRH